VDRLYTPTPAQVAGMQAMVEKRLTQYDQVWQFVTTFDPTTLCGNPEECKCVGAHHVLDEIRAILEVPTAQDDNG
jgi:hypothetical protein